MSLGAICLAATQTLSTLGSLLDACFTNVFIAFLKRAERTMEEEEEEDIYSCKAIKQQRNGSYHELRHELVIRD